MAGELQGLGRWRLLDVCADGEFATIYRARAADAGVTEQSLALKVVRSESLHDELESDAFEKRTRRAIALSDTAPHRAIVRVRDCGEVDGRGWASMELVDGISLDRIGAKRSRGRLPLEGAVVVLRELLEALDAALSCRNPTSHGRLGRSHILLDTDGAVRLIGFGAADYERADLLAVGRLANQITKSWPSEVDAWIDQLTDDEAPFASAGDALEAFPMQAFDEDVLEIGRKALARLVTRERKKAERAAAKAAEASTLDADESPDAEDESPNAEDESLGAEDAAVVPLGNDEFGTTIRQARGVMWACAALLFLAVTVELMRFGG
jgi:serine/threonine protein kinase